MKKLILASLIVVETSFAAPMPPQPQAPMQPMQSSSTPQPMPIPPNQSIPPSQANQPTPSPMPTQAPPSPTTTQPSVNPMPPVEIKPEDRAIINLKKKMTIKQVYNDYQKVDKATSIDRLNLEKSLREAKYALKSQIYKEKQLDSQLPYPYYYNIPVAGVVGNLALTSQTPLKDGTVLRGKDKVSVKDGLVYVGDYLISYPVMDNMKQPKVDTTSTTSSAPQLLTGLPTSNINTSNSPIGTPPIPLPPPTR
jgi:hypothetical protein